MPKVEDGLQRMLESDSAANEWIDVVVSFDMPNMGATAFTPAADPAQRSFSTAALVDDRKARSSLIAKHIRSVLENAGDMAGEQPEILSQQPLLGSAVVKAHPSYFRALLVQPGIKGAVLNSGLPPVMGQPVGR